MSEVVNELKQERCEGHCIKECAACIYCTAKWRKESFAKAMENLKSKIFGQILRVVIEEVTEYKKLNIYRRPSVAEKEAVVKVTGAKDI